MAASGAYSGFDKTGSKRMARSKSAPTTRRNKIGYFKSKSSYKSPPFNLTLSDEKVITMSKPAVNGKFLLPLSKGAYKGDPKAPPRMLCLWDKMDTAGHINRNNMGLRVSVDSPHCECLLPAALKELAITKEELKKIKLRKGKTPTPRPGRQVSQEDKDDIAIISDNVLQILANLEREMKENHEQHHFRLEKYQKLQGQMQDLKKYVSVLSETDKLSHEKLQVITQGILNQLGNIETCIVNLKDKEGENGDIPGAEILTIGHEDLEQEWYVKQGNMSQPPAYIHQEYKIEVSLNDAMERYYRYFGGPQKRRVQDEINREDDLSGFIENNFEIRQCKKYIENGVDSDTCCCSEHSEWHRNRGIHPVTADRHMTWNKNEHAKMSKNDYYGEMTFPRLQKIVQYCLMDMELDQKVDQVKKLLTDHWKVILPNFLISIVEADSDVYCKLTLSTLYKKGLIKAATCTNSWIVTSGTTTGMNRYVRQAVSEHLLNEPQEKITVLGVAFWKNINDKEQLHKKNGWKKCYSSTHVFGRQTVDNSNTILFFLDDRICTEEYKLKQKIASLHHISKLLPTYQESESKISLKTAATQTNVMDKIQAEQSKLEEQASGEGLIEKIQAEQSKPEQQASGKATEEGLSTDFPDTLDADTNTGKWLPIVHVVCGGDMMTIKLTVEAANRGHSIVVIAGSGCAADVIAYAHQLNISKSGEKEKKAKKEQIVRKIKQMLNLGSDAYDNNIIEELTEVTKEKITIFDQRRNNYHYGIDNAIMSALLNANSNLKDVEKLELCQKWNRSDVADDEIQDFKKLEDKIIKEKLLKMSLEDKPDFVKLFLDKGFKLHIIKDKEISKLYMDTVEQNNTQKHKALGTILKRLGLKEDKEKGTKLKKIGMVIHGLMKHRLKNPYRKNKIQKEQNTDDIHDQDTGVTNSSLKDPKEEKNPKENRKETDRSEAVALALYLWAVLSNRMHLAKLFWTAGTNHIATALTGSIIFESLSVKAKEIEYVDMVEELKKNSEEFKGLAIGILDECNQDDLVKMRSLLIKKSTTWPKATLFDLAVLGENIDFMDNNGVEIILDKIWKGNIALSTPYYKIVAGLFLPLLSLDFNVEASFDLDVKPKLGNKVSPSGSNIEDQQTSGEYIPIEKQQIFLRPKSFYFAPVTKFFYHTLSYLVYLALFSVFLMTDMRPVGQENSPGVIEYIIWFWTCTFVLEEIRQFTLHKSHMSYWSNAWNILDIVTFGFFVMCIILRLSLKEEYFVWARMCYAITLAMCIVRFTQVFFVSKQLGPKVVMIRRMLGDIAMFLVIFFTVISAYGVASQTLRYPNTPFSWTLITDVVYIPYWQIYGELFVEEMEGEVDGCTNDSAIWMNDPDTPRCPEKSPLTTLLLAVYLLFVNVLLINLLIALFSHTFKQTQQKAEAVWRFYRYRLIEKYEGRPVMVPPFMIIETVIYFIRHKKKSNIPNLLREKYKCHKDKEASKLYEQIAGFELKNRDKHLRKLDDRMF